MKGVIPVEPAQAPITMTAKDAAALLGISYWKLTMMCKAKEIPHLRVGNRLLFRKETLERWMANQEILSVRPIGDHQIPLIKAKG
jgi:excisionase family DNA binding protein